MNVKNIWILPFRGSLISIIGLFTPTAFSYFLNEYHELTQYFWMWGLIYSRYYFFENFNTKRLGGFPIFYPEIFVPGLIATILILSSAVSCIKTALRFRKGQCYFSEVKKSWLITGILYIISVIIYAVGMQIGFPVFQQRFGGSPLNFWQNYLPNFGIIAPFISGLLVIVGVILGTVIMRKEDALFSNKISSAVS